ncbi:hypothetical protein [Gulosibacter sp. 10]|uniref:hypothetical protein n=1 Tax=Gulosibacter sp. 10 TaxID=1255570 RepID=UPI00097F54B9|nr:hypothetical protein [Gulosibacter sp. 10]SJM67671.1 hypothetical protein FM112_12775 [Gulosibacter sp. 10]
MRSRAARYSSLLAAAILSLGLAACSSEDGAPVDGSATGTGAPAEDAVSPSGQTLDEACAIYSDEVIAALQETNEAMAAEMEAGRTPDFAANMQTLLEAAESTSEQIDLPQVAEPLAAVEENLREVLEVVQDVDYGSVDPAAEDAANQYADLNQAALEEAGVADETFEPMAEIAEACGLDE